MRVQEMIQYCKTLGLPQCEREQVTATLRDSGDAEAIELAQNYAARRANQIAGAEAASRQLFGITI